MAARRARRPMKDAKDGRLHRMGGFLDARRRIGDQACRRSGLFRGFGDSGLSRRRAENPNRHILFRHGQLGNVRSSDKVDQRLDLREVHVRARNFNFRRAELKVRIARRRHFRSTTRRLMGSDEVLMECSQRLVGPIRGAREVANRQAWSLEIPIGILFPSDAVRRGSSRSRHPRDSARRIRSLRNR